MHRTTALTAGFLEGASGQRLFHVFERPVHCEPALTVLFVPPFAEELNKSRRMLALQSRALAAAGCVTLRADLTGCGDSEGELGDATWDMWIDDVAAAARALRTQCDAPLWLCGLRSGAVLASHAAARIDDVHGWLLWQPLLTGQTAMHQFLRLLTAGELGSGDRVSMADLWLQLDQGHTLEVAGYPLSAQLARPMAAAQLLSPVTGTTVEWMEVSSRPEAALLPASAVRAQQWQDAGIHVRTHVARGPLFWQTTETEIAPDLISLTTGVLTLSSPPVAAP